MAVGVLVVDDRRPVAPSEVRDRRRRVLRMQWVAVVASAVAFGCALGYLVNDEVHANDRYDRFRASLEVTRRNVATATKELAVARRELALVTAQVGSDSTALAQDDSQLQAAQSALSAAMAHLSQQTTRIGALHTCLGGVEQALNALAVKQQAKAIFALSAVATSCTEATSSG